MWYVSFSEDVSSDYITPIYMFRFECHIIVSEYFIASYVLSANVSHDGTSRDRLSEMDKDKQVLI